MRFGVGGVEIHFWAFHGARIFFVRNEFEFDASYKGVTKFAIVLLKVASSELNFPSPYVDRTSLRELVLPNILERIDGIQSYLQAQDIVKEIG